MENETFDLIVTIVILIVGLLFYFLPYIVKTKRHPQPDMLFLLNFFLGWTIIGWIAALIWGQQKNKTKKQIVQSDSPAEQIRKYKDLLDSGAISQEEYASAKAAIVSPRGVAEKSL